MKFCFDRQLADTADQDGDKSRTYDYARVEYSHLDLIVYLGLNSFLLWLSLIDICFFYKDADELFFCPQSSESADAQRDYQQKIMAEFKVKGIEEMRFVRIPYSGM